MRRRRTMVGLAAITLAGAWLVFGEAAPAAAQTVTVAQPPLTTPAPKAAAQPAAPATPPKTSASTATAKGPADVVAVAAVPAAPPEPGQYGYALPSLYGPSGTLRVVNADSGPAGTFRVQLSGEVFKATEFLAPGDSNTRVGGRLLLGISPLDWLEVYATVTGHSNDNNQGAPPLIQVQGDFGFGVKGCYWATKFLCVGAMGGLQFLTGAGDISFTGKSTSAHLRLLTTTDFTRMDARLPLRVSFNFGGYIDNSDALLNPSFTPVQRYGLRINESSRLFLGLNVEAPVSRYVTPFLEWSFEIPVGLPDVANAAGASSWPNILSIGARVFPWRQLALLAAVDLGLTQSGRRGVPAIPGAQVVFGIGWAFDSAPTVQTKVVEKVVTKEVVKEKIVEKTVPVPTPVAAPPTTGWLVGAVVDSKTAAPVVDAAVRFVNADYSAVLSSKLKGELRVEGLKPGRLQIRIEKEGYKPADFEVEIYAGKPTANSFPIDRAPETRKTAVLVGKLTDESGKALVGIIEARGAGGSVRKLASEPSTGAFVGTLDPGSYQLVARSTGYLSKEKSVTLNEKDRVVVDFALRKEPEKRIARLEGSKIVISKQVRFKTNSAKIIGKQSFRILDEVVDILVRNPQIKRIRVEGHTDNVGAKKRNQKLSDNRARSVMQYMVEQGVAPSRVDSAGFGQTRPLVPNTNKKNRAKNRRVEFIIVEQ